MDRSLTSTFRAVNKPLAGFLSSVDNPGTMVTCFRFSFQVSLTLNGMGGWNPPPPGRFFLHCAKSFGTRELKLFDF